MTEFSQSERRGLKQTQARDVQHPDADLLSAFAEQALTSREREQVMSHLAMCSTCREVVAFAAPDASVQVPVVEPAGKLSPWNWPVVRWGSVAAVAAVVIAAVGVSNYMNHQPVQKSTTTEQTQIARALPAESATGENKVAADTTASGGVSGIQKEKIRYEKMAPGVTNAPQVASIPKGVLDKQLEAKKETRYISPPVDIQQGRSFGVVAGMPNDELAGGLPIPAAPLADMMRAQAAREDPMEKDLDLLAQANAAPPPPARADTENYTSSLSQEAAPSASANTEPQEQRRARIGSPQLRSGFVAQRAQKVVAPHPLPGSQWRIENGILQNSADNGQNWANVLAQFRFTQVQSVDNRVWAAGPNGLLLQSIDSGITWRRIMPRHGLVAMKGDVISISMSNTQNATITTSTGETWTTTDGGNTWTKQ